MLIEVSIENIDEEMVINQIIGLYDFAINKALGDTDGINDRGVETKGQK